MVLHTFGKEERIHSRSDFLRISKEGTKYSTGYFRVALCPNRLPSRRLGITAGKNVGTAVERNRVKRRIRECFRLNKEIFPDSTDIVITAKKGAAGLNFWQITEELKGLLRGRPLP